MDQRNLEQFTSQQTLAAIVQAAMDRSPTSQQKIAEVFQELSDTLAKLQGTTDQLRGHHDGLIDSYRTVAEHSQHYQYLFDQSPSSLIITTIEGEIQDLNTAAIALLHHGRTSEEAHSHPIGRSLLSYIPPESFHQVSDYLTQITENTSTGPQAIETWLINTNGQQHWVQLSAQMLFTPDNHPHGINWAITDMTHHRQTELDLKSRINEIHQNYADIQQVNQQLEEAVQTKNSQVLKATEFESTLKRITDKVRDSLDESTILQTVVKELSVVLRLGGCNTALYDLDKGTSTISYEYTNFISAYRGKVAQMDHFPELYNQLKQGRYFQFCSLIPNPERGHVSLLACPIFMDADEKTGSEETVLGDLWLIDRKEHVFNEFEIRLVQQVANQCAIAIRQARLYKAAQAQVHELEKLNRLKDEFLSTVSHELRTPISNVKMAIHMLKNAPTEEKRERYIQILEAESQREAALINDLLDLQKLEVSTYTITPKTLQVSPWLDGVLHPFCSRIETHHQTLDVDSGPNTLALRTDFSVLERILAELLNNACKYTPSDHAIRIHIAQEPYASAVTITLSNQAEIPATELPHIFDKFYRVPHSDPWKQGGTGLGLALVEKLVEQLEGAIEVTSSDGWTHFVVTIPDQG